MLKLILFFFVFGQFYSAQAQLEGYWDKERTFSKEISVTASERLILSIDELPPGTTELVYRITLLDDNQKTTSSLISVLKAIPDPTGISQGSAGAILLLSKIAGDDQCTYAIFSNSDEAKNYKQNGSTKKACWAQHTPVSKDARRLTVSSSSCFSSQSIWFGFDSANWIMDQRILVEVVPWVNSKLSTGWTSNAKNEVIDLCASTDLAQQLAPSQSYCGCVLERITAKYTYAEYSKLLAAEKAKAFTENSAICFVETNGEALRYANQQQLRESFIAEKKFGEAIKQSLVLLDSPKTTSADYTTLGWLYVVTKQYDKALLYLQQAVAKDPTDLTAQVTLAHAYLFHDDFPQAKAIYKKYQTQNVSDSISWNSKIEQDFAEFTALGLPTSNFKRVIRLVE